MIDFELGMNCISNDVLYTGDGVLYTDVLYTGDGALWCPPCQLSCYTSGLNIKVLVEEYQVCIRAKLQCPLVTLLTQDLGWVQASCLQGFYYGTSCVCWGGGGGGGAEA